MFLMINIEKWREIKKQSFSQYYMSNFIKFSIFFIFIAAFFNIVTDINHSLKVSVPKHLIYDLLIPLILSAILTYCNCTIEKNLNFMLYSDEEVNKKKFKFFYILNGVIWVSIVVNLISVLSLANIYNKKISELVLDIFAGIFVGIIIGLFYGIFSFKKFYKNHENDFDKSKVKKKSNKKKKK
ncbi:hypothetical protein [Clostridium fallax]|uniref:Uncharacterized protein n=1 Tax=Clostridium fallax TaxID=1533 RepID=A0A1M4YTS6_9CLOT|nr:hypothetical protein [Clostridium fallax]SHF09133.1 hypothetical protein SAMN05443638_1323 [Clostridium fallax]SQB22187.1 Uncharacterised protein [Clostridium fallax]